MKLKVIIHEAEEGGFGQKLNRMVYQLFGLKEEEIRVVENFR